jgi:hypothetical protein
VGPAEWLLLVAEVCVVADVWLVLAAAGGVTLCVCVGVEVTGGELELLFELVLGVAIDGRLLCVDRCWRETRSRALWRAG